MTDPPPSGRSVTWHGSHRLIPSRYSESGTVLSTISKDDDTLLADLVLLDGATNDRIQGEEQGLPGISPYELLYGVPNAHIVNAAFTHASDDGSRFNDGTRGAWYTARQLETSIAEVVYHKARRLGEIIVPDLPWQKPDEEASTFDDWLADFRSTFHILEPAGDYLDYLQPEPVPGWYARSQILAKHLLNSGSNGLVYPSVRRNGQQCLVCFRPALVYNPRRAGRFEISFRATPESYTHRVRRLPQQ